MHDSLQPVRLKSAPGVTVSFLGQGLTEYAGVALLTESMRHIGWDELIGESLPFQRVKSPLGYLTQEVITAAVVGIALGARRPEHLDRVRADGFPAAALGRDCLPSSVTTWRHLLEYEAHGDAGIGALARINLTLVRRTLGRGRKAIDLDLDGTVCTLYGQQEGAVKGYNPEHKGKRSYFPLLAVCVDKQMVFGQQWRPGNSGAATGDVRLLQSIWDQLPWHCRDRLRVRFDSAHYDGSLMSWCEDRQVSFTVKARRTTALMRAVASLEFQPLRIGDRELEVAELVYRSDEWDRSRRHVVYRERQPEVRDAQGRLFPEPVYEFSIIATSLRWMPAEVWEYYNARAEAENMIEDLKNSLGYGVAPTSRMLPNGVWAWLQILAFNLLSPLRSVVAAREHVRPKVRTLRDRLLRVVAKVAQHSRRVLVGLNASWAEARLFRRLLTLAPSTA